MITTAARSPLLRLSPVARGGRYSDVHSPRWPRLGLVGAQLALTAAALLAQVFGNPLDTSAITPIACGLLLTFGLPHGTLDLELLRRRDNRGPGISALLFAYGACAAAMYALWLLAPLLALIVFIAMAVLHFGEDWQDMGDGFVARGTAVAMIALPALRHRPELAAIFVSLTGTASAASLGDILLLVAPVAGIIALAGAGLLWQSGLRRNALALAGALLAEALLPPVIGFSLFFCFVHSPAQLREAIAQLQRPTRDAWLKIIFPLTIAAIALAVLIGAAEIRNSVNAGALRACFVTLSVLTIPHMVVPFLARRYRPVILRAGPRSAD